MPASLSEVTQSDTRNHFVGDSYQQKIFPSKSIGSHLLRTQNNTHFEGFAGNEFAEVNQNAISTMAPSKLALLTPGPEPLQSSSQFGQMFHPINLTTREGGLSMEITNNLEKETENILCKDAMSHYRKCKTCRQQIILELQNMNAVSGNDLVLGGQATLHSRKKNEMSEIATLAGAGIFTIFLIDAFSKFGARLHL